MKRSAALVGIGLALGAVWAGSARASALTCGQTIGSAGVYQLTSDLSCPAGTALTVAADGPVTIAFGRHTLNGVGTGAVGIEASSDVTLLNGVIRGFGTGVDASQDHVTLSGMRVAHNGEGLFGELSVWFSIGNSFINENSDLGIRDAVGGISIADSQVNGNGANGIDASETSLVALRNAISRNGGFGIRNDEFGVDLEGNQVDDNGADGISLGFNPFPDPYTLLGNTAVGNGGHGIVYAPGSVGVIDHPLDAEANVARDNAADPQCIGIFCRSS